MSVLIVILLSVSIICNSSFRLVLNALFRLVVGRSGSGPDHGADHRPVGF